MDGIRKITVRLSSLTEVARRGKGETGRLNKISYRVLHARFDEDPDEALVSGW